MNNKLLYSLFIILIIMFGFLFISNQNTLFTKNIYSESTINLSSRQEMEFSPDEVEIILGVETRSDNLETAQNDNNNKVNKVKKVLAEYDKLEIANTSFNINPVYENEKEQQKIKYYKIRNMLEIKSTDLDLISKIIDESLNAGANTVYNLQYSLKNEEDAKRMVIEKALNNLKNKINYIKNNLDKNDYKIKKLNINDSLQSSFLSVNNMRSNIPESSSNSTNIDPEKIKISVTIRAEYVLIE